MALKSLRSWGVGTVIRVCTCAKLRDRPMRLSSLACTIQIPQ